MNRNLIRNHKRVRFRNRNGCVIAVSLLCAVTAVSGCASSSLTSGSIETSSVGTFLPDGRYRLSQAEQDLDCRRITGRMQVRILQVRDRLKTNEGNSIAAVAYALNPFSKASDPPAGSAQATRNDVAILNAYNQSLAAKQCPTFDLAEELKPKDVRHTPRPLRAIR